MIEKDWIKDWTNGETIHWPSKWNIKYQYVKIPFCKYYSLTIYGNKETIDKIKTFKIFAKHKGTAELVFECKEIPPCGHRVEYLRIREKKLNKMLKIVREFFSQYEGDDFYWKIYGVRQWLKNKKCEKR